MTAGMHAEMRTTGATPKGLAAIGNAGTGRATSGHVTTARVRNGPVMTVANDLATSVHETFGPARVAIATRGLARAGASGPARIAVARKASAKIGLATIVRATTGPADQGVGP